jgi:energy-coupling factor transport system ATP-binding protein
VRGVDLRIERGERVLLLGASGAGKSTLLAALAGLLPADSGECAGELHVEHETVGVVFQDPQTQLVMARAGDDVAFGLENRGVPREQIWPRVHAALRQVGFAYGPERPTAALSGGEQQRLAIAGALVTQPSLLLLDEPTANLDPAGAELVRDALKLSTSDDRTMVLVDHRVTEALPLVDRVIELAPGEGVRLDCPAETYLMHHGAALRNPRPRKSRTAPGPELIGAHEVTMRSLSHVSVAARAAEALAVVGPNGAGKSTLALLLGGLLKPERGTVRATPHLGDPVAPPHRWRARYLAARIGSVFQNPEHQFVTGTVRDELALGPRRTGRPLSIVDELLDRLRLAHLARANPYTLSGGEQRRLSVATALATAPALLILDEPTFGQDRPTWRELVDLIAGQRDEGRGVVLVTHDADLVATVADRTVELA